MRSPWLLIAALATGAIAGGPQLLAAASGVLLPQALAQAAETEAPTDEPGLDQDDFQRARIEGNRLVLRGEDEDDAAPAGDAAAADEGTGDEAVANGRAEAMAGADAAAADDAQAAGIAPAGEVEANAGAEAASNAGAEAASIPGAATADMEAEAAAEADADARLAEREAAALDAVDRAAEEEAAAEAPPAADVTAPGDAAGGAVAGAPDEAIDDADAAPVAGELTEEGDAAAAAEAADAAARDEAAALDAEEPLPAADAPEPATDTPVEGDAALAAEPPAAVPEPAPVPDPTPVPEPVPVPDPGAEQTAAEELTPAQQRAAAARAAAEERAQRMNDVVGAVNQLNLNQQEIDERTLDLQAEQDALRDRGTGLEDARLARIATYDAAMTRLLDVADFLATGGGTGADAQLLDLAVSLGELAQNAYQTSGEEEASQLLTAQETVEASRAMLAQDDPFGARMYLRATMDALTAARTVAESSAEPLFREE